MKSYCIVGLIIRLIAVVIYPFLSPDRKVRGHSDQPGVHLSFSVNILVSALYDVTRIKMRALALKLFELSPL